MQAGEQRVPDVLRGAVRAETDGAAAAAGERKNAACRARGGGKLAAVVKVERNGAIACLLHGAYRCLRSAAQIHQARFGVAGGPEGAVAALNGAKRARSAA